MKKHEMRTATGDSTAKIKINYKYICTKKWKGGWPNGTLKWHVMKKNVTVTYRVKQN